MESEGNYRPVDGSEREQAEQDIAQAIVKSAKRRHSKI